MNGLTLAALFFAALLALGYALKNSPEGNRK